MWPESIILEIIYRNGSLNCVGINLISC